MKRLIYSTTTIVCIMVCMTANAQKYKTSADTIKLNKEYIDVSNEIASLTSKLAIAQNNLPGYHDRADNATSNAQNMAVKSSETASNAVNGDLKDAKKARKKANKAVREAKDANHANNKVKDQDAKIAKLTSELQNKQNRLAELDAMRASIRNAQ